MLYQLELPDTPEAREFLGPAFAGCAPTIPASYDWEHAWETALHFPGAKIYKVTGAFGRKLVGRSASIR